jgi:general secretion pathway protein A
MKTFYGLTENPFAPTPDPKFFYWSPAHRKTFQLLVRSQQSPKGIIVLTGARGTGKTALLQAFATIQEPRARIVLLPHAASSVPGLYGLLAQQLGVESDTQQTPDQRSQLHAWLCTCVQHRGKIVLLLDNAHEWSENLLTEIEVLASLGTPTSKLFHIVLAGSLSLLDHLKAPGLASLRARVEGVGQLSPLDLLDTQAYIYQRLAIAGWSEGALFDPAAVEVIYSYSQGIPRAINQLCSQVLLAGFAAHVRRINAEIVRHVATRMGLPEPTPVRPAHAAPASQARAKGAQSEDTTATQQPTYPRRLWPGTAGQLRSKAARRRRARLARALLPLGVILLIVAGSVVVLGGGLQERRTPLLALAPLVVSRNPPVTPESQLDSGRVLEAEAEPAAGAIQSDAAMSIAREATNRHEYLLPESKKQAEPSPQETLPSTARAKRLMATASPPNVLSQGAVSTTLRETLQRPPQPSGTTRLAKTSRAQPHEPTQPLARRGPAVPPAIPRHSEPVAHDTLGTAERPTPSPQRQAQLVQDDLPLGAAPHPGGMTDARFSGQASDTPEATQPPRPLWSPPEGPEGPAVLPRSPEPPREAAPPAQRVPTAAWEMTRPVPAQPLQGHTVEIHTGLARASVLINGKYIGQTPVVIHLPLGVYTMAIDNPGYAQMTWKMHVDPNGVALHMTRQRGWSWAPPYAPRVLAY